MATSVQAPMYSKPGMWNLDRRSSPSSSDLEGLSTSMSSQYQLPVSGIDSSNLFPCFRGPSEFAQTPSPALANQKSPAVEPRLSVAAKTTKRRKSMSSLNPRGSALTDSATLALSVEKKRNKLGYHRTSVACGHCRRRKIRCIPASGDKRCSNCIRLKKECNFYPVDQQSTTGLSRRVPEAQSATRRISEELSLTSTISDQIPDMSMPLPFSPALSMPSIEKLGCSQTKRQRTVRFSPTANKVIRSASDFDGYNNNADNSSWMSSDVLHVSESSQEPPPFWLANPQDSPLTSCYSPFNPGLQIPSLQNWSSAHTTDPSSREDLPWPPRSVSYNNIEGLNSLYPYVQYNPTASHQAEYRATKPPTTHPSGVYPIPISSSANSLTSLVQFDDRPRHLNVSNTPFPVPISSWEQSYSYQKHSSPGSDQYEAWGENQGDIIQLQGEPVNENLSSFASREPGREIFYPLNPGR